MEELLIVTEEQKQTIRATFDLDEAGIQRDVDAVVEWYKKQHHLPRVELDRDVVERVLIQRKASVEQTKQKIDLMYTVRALMPELASPRDVLHPDLQRQFRAVKFAVMPKLNKDNTRVLIFDYTNNIDDFVYVDVVKYIIMLTEYRLKHDYCLGDRYIMDFKRKKLQHLGKEPPSVSKNAELFIRQSYGSRIFGIHMVNCPPFIDKIVSLIKLGLSDKLQHKLCVHPTFVDLHKHISKEVLPREYEGEAADIATVAELWKAEMSREDTRRYLMSQEALRSDETLRLGAAITDDTLGIAGTFKTISVD